MYAIEPRLELSYIKNIYNTLGPILLSLYTDWGIKIQVKTQDFVLYNSLKAQVLLKK